jgi:hypothetical protein
VRAAAGRPEGRNDHLLLAFSHARTPF